MKFRKLFLIFLFAFSSCSFNQLAHTHTPAEPVKENEILATCTMGGSYDMVVYCVDDHQEMSREHFTTSALGHDLRSYNGKEPTCTEDGYAPYEACSRCDYSTYSVIPALGHQEDTPVRENVIQPDCINPGSYDEVIYCKRDGVELSRVTKTIDPLGHDLVPHDGKEPTCTEDGYAPYHTCTRCSYSTFVKIDAKGHKAGEGVKKNVVEATCTTEGGYDLVSYCQDCGVYLGESHIVVNALGHNLIHHHAKESTCYSHGYDEYDECSRCDYSTKVEKAYTSHTPTSYIDNIIAPNLEHNGTYDVVSKCLECDEELSRVTKDIGNSEHIRLTNNDVELLLSDYYRFELLTDNIDVTWSVSNEDILSINQNGKLVSYDIGEAIVFATNSNGEVASAYIKILDDEIDIKVPDGYHTVEDVFQMEVIKCTRYIEDIIWSSSDNDIAEIDIDGNVLAKKVGTCNIRATLKSGRYQEVPLNIVKNEIIVKQNSIELRRNRSYVLNAVETKPGVMTFVSSNDNIVSVNSEGIITTHEMIGEASITINSSTCGSKTIYITVYKTVLDPHEDSFWNCFEYGMYEEVHLEDHIHSFLLRFKMKDGVFFESYYLEIEYICGIKKSGYQTQYKQDRFRLSPSIRQVSINFALNNFGVDGWTIDKIWAVQYGSISI